MGPRLKTPTSESYSRKKKKEVAHLGKTGIRRTVFRGKNPTKNQPPIGGCS